MPDSSFFSMSCQEIEERISYLNTSYVAKTRSYLQHKTVHGIISKGNKGEFFTLNACHSNIDCKVEVVSVDASLTK